MILTMTDWMSLDLQMVTEPYKILIIWSGQDDIDQSQPEPVLTLDQNTVEENSLGATIGSISFLNLDG